jgi:hypothetical protein
LRLSRGAVGNTVMIVLSSASCTKRGRKENNMAEEIMHASWIHNGISRCGIKTSNTTWITNNITCKRCIGSINKINKIIQKRNGAVYREVIKIMRENRKK